ncbi:MAG TPA: methyltransferase domain-containing protein [Stellaceae bacterium]|nr:methyltransferase domain-containing protein [Stellaceae bacterium]
MAWDPTLYLKFGDERLRPGFELLARIGELPPGPLVELGCGTGVHARAIAARWPERRLTAIDRSREMLAKAAAEPSPIRWLEADIASWSAPEPAALIFSNATLQWLGGHAQLFPHLMRQLAPGGVLAVQMPRNFDQPSHALMRETAREGSWSAKLVPVVGGATVLREEPVAPPEWYYDLLAPQAPDGLDLWETDYLHVLAGEDPVLQWVSATALRPVIEALDGSERADFLAAYGAKLRQAYPRRADGKTLLPFRRLFLVVRARSGA